MFSISPSILITLNLIAIINIVILCVYLCFRKNNILPNYVLAVIFLVPALYFVDNILVLNGLIFNWYYCFFIVQILATLFPIAVYYYVHLLLADNKRFHKVLATGSVALFFYIIYLTVNFYYLSPSEKTEYLSGLNNEEHYPFTMLLYTVLFYAWQMVYFIVLVFEIKKYSTNAEDSFSNFENIKIDYVKRFMMLLGILNSGLVVFYSTLPMPLVDYGVLPTFVTIIYIFIMFNTVKYNVVFSKKSYERLVEENKTMVDFGEQTVGVANEIISNDLIDDKVKLLGAKIEEILVGQKVYHNPDFKLSFLADKLNEPSYVVSRALNKYFHKSFYELVNELRIKEAETRLQLFDPKKETIEGLAYDVGFNSRAAFYRSFKKYTGKIPKDYTNINN